MPMPAAAATPDSLEEQAARFVADLARALPDDLRTMAFASPLSARSPDLSLLWLPGYHRSRRGRFLVKAVMSLGIGILKGLGKLWPGLRRYGFKLYGMPRGRLLVVPNGCGTEVAGRFETPYVPTSPEDAVFVFGDVGRDADGWQQIGVRLRRDIVKPLWELIRAGVRILSGTAARDVDTWLLFLVWLEWSVSLRWLRYASLERGLRAIVVRHGIQRLGCIHEMHPHSRVVWRVAAAHGVLGYALQHAAFSPAKRWLYPRAQEREAGLATPAVWYVYDDRTARMLSPCYPTTQFYMGHSARYANWTAVTERCNGAALLFVTALPRFDSAVVVGAMRSLVKAGRLPRRIDFRPHPAARMRLRDRLWIAIAAVRGTVQVARERALAHDLSHAALVLGMGSTALLDSLRAGVPVVQLFHPDYADYLALDKAAGCTRLDARMVSPSALETAATCSVDTEGARKRLGLDFPLVTYDRLFAHVEARNDRESNTS